MKKLASLLVLALVSAALIACGGDDSTTTTDTSGGAAAEGGEKAGDGAGAGSAVQFEAAADGGLSYTTDEATAKAGEVAIDFTNAQSLAHDVAIEDPSGKLVGKTDVITDSNDSTKVNLKPGDYTFYCTVPGHREGGMEGSLTVE